MTLQGHLDMVCERDPSSPNDPAEGRIAFVRDGEWLTADGTTLGADDGVAIAAMMALVEDESLPHGPLELLMTVAEEVGLEGANALDPALVTGSILVNLDSEEDGRLTVGCAGSTDTWIRIEAPREEPEGDQVTLGVTVSGGSGGHSGTGIALGPVERRQGARAGAARGARDGAVPARLVRGRQEPQRDPARRDRDLLRRCRPGTCLPGRGRRRGRDDPRRVRKTDAGVTVDVEPADATELPWTDDGDEDAARRRRARAHRPARLSPDFDDLVETSTSLGEAITEGDELTLHSLSRSSNDSALPEVIATLDAAARLGGGALEVKRNYGGWRPDLDSPALAAAEGGLRAPVRRAADRHRGARRAGDRGHREQGAGARHALVRPPDRVSALAGRAR